LAKIRVFLADDHEAILERVRALLDIEFDIVGTANNGRDAVAEALRLDPDVVVIDIAMPILDGLQAASQLQSSNCRCKIVFLTVHEDQDFVAAALACGGSCYVTKSRLMTDLIPAIREALQGHQFVSQFTST
jgi:two-component system response regulator NreC